MLLHLHGFNAAKEFLLELLFNWTICLKVKNNYGPFAEGL